MTIPDFLDSGWLPPGHYQADWDDVVRIFRNGEGSRRASLTDKLLDFRDALRAEGVTGVFILDGSYISGKEVPSDFDIILIADPNLSSLKELSQNLQNLLDAEKCEKERGFSFLFCPNNSSLLDQLSEIWDYTKDGSTSKKGVLEVEL